MARSKSVILSKDEKKLVVAQLKARIKNIQGDLKNVSKGMKAANKEYAATVKDSEKISAALAKDLASQQAQLDALLAAA